MPRANRHYLPGQLWHITHRCHKMEFLLQETMGSDLLKVQSCSD